MYGRMQLIPFLCISAIWGQCSPWGVVDSAREQALLFLSSENWRAGIPDGCDILVYWYDRKYFISQELYTEETILEELHLPLHLT